MNSPLVIATRPGIVAVQGDLSDTAEHRHRALQLSLHDDACARLEVKGEQIDRRGWTLIAPDTPHRFSCPRAIMVLINPETHAGQTLSQQYLSSGNFAPIELSVEPELLSGFLARLLKQLNVPDCMSFHGERRLSLLLDDIQQRLQQHRLTDVTLEWACEQTHLSESRFMHLFKQEMGVAWRPFLLWQRLLAAVLAVQEGYDLTQASQIAGFSDSAHLSRTFRSNFGITPSLALKDSRFIQAG